LEQADTAAENEWFFRVASIWGVFVVSNLILRVVTDRIARTRMKFVKPLEMTAGPAVGLLVALMFASFAACTMRVPIAAGAWKTSDASESVNGAMQKLAGPFAGAISGFYSGEFTVTQFDVKAPEVKAP
ncbi:MAG: hypothetical protein AAF961_16665, partial [Planctomycetota bacterium]